MLSLYFNNVRIPDWIKVTNITEDILPNLEVTKDKTKFGEKKIIVEFKFKRNKLIDHKLKYEILQFVKGDNFKESKLILPGRSEYYYMAKVTNLSSISGSIRKGEGTIEFTCFNYKEIQVNPCYLDIRNKNSVDINYIGTEKTYPKIKFKVNSQCNKIKLIVNYGLFLEFNHSFNAGDILEIDQEVNKVTLNGLLNMEIWHLKSKRIKFKYGLNTLRVLEGNVDVTVKWNNTFL